MMFSDLTTMDASGWDILKKALNQRVVVVRSSLVPSYRNRVWLVETDVRPVVVKRSLSRRSPVEFETMLLAKRAGLSVPYPLYMDKDYLVTEYISGDSCDMLVNTMFSTRAAEGLGRWLGAFHESMDRFGKPMAMSDAVLDNFIMHEGEVYGVDLEDSAPGNPMDDLGQMASSILGNEPFFTPIKFDLCFSHAGGVRGAHGHGIDGERQTVRDEASAPVGKGKAALQTALRRGRKGSGQDLAGPCLITPSSPRPAQPARPLPGPSCACSGRGSPRASS